MMLGGLHIEFRHPNAAEMQTVQAFVQTEVDQVYGDILPVPVPIGTSDWRPAWIVVVEHQVVRVALTAGEWVEDLWIARVSRGHGIGTNLLSRCEAEIQERGFNVAKLRVVNSNHRAIHFYEAHGWTAKRTYLHETLPVAMTELTKAL